MFMYMENPHIDSSPDRVSCLWDSLHEKTVPQALQVGKDLCFTCAG